MDLKMSNNLNASDDWLDNIFTCFTDYGDDRVPICPHAREVINQHIQDEVRQALIKELQRIKANSHYLSHTSYGTYYQTPLAIIDDRLSTLKSAGDK
jgi:hypothetical protein